MKEKLANSLARITKIPQKEILALIEIPQNPEFGDYAFPCFSLSKILKKAPEEIAKTIAKEIKLPEGIEKLEIKGPYVNFFINSQNLAQIIIKKILKEKDKYGSSDIGKNKKIVIDMSSPNIAKPFGIGHLRSTIIGNSVANISSFLGFKPIKINYLGDWGTQFGKIIAGYERFGDEKKLREKPVKHLYEIYVKVNKDQLFDEKGRDYFKKLESGEKKYISLWKKFRNYSIIDFKKIYALLNVKFDVFSGESFYNKKISQVINELERKSLLERSDNALIIDLRKYNFGIALIEKTDGTGLYLTRDIAAAQDRHAKYKFYKMFYEVGSEQNLHFKQLFKILKLMGHEWAEDCRHIAHGLYLDKNGKKLATRKGKTVFMEEILDEIIGLSKTELKKRGNLTEKELKRRAIIISRAAIIYGDLKNYRENDIVFDINHFLSFEGNTGPYLLYTYARARSILSKAEYNPKTKYKIDKISEKEKNLISQLSAFPNIILNTYKNLAPNLIANYAYQTAQIFNELYHSEKIIGSENQQFKLSLVDSFSQVLKNSLNLLNIQTLEEM